VNAAQQDVIDRIGRKMMDVLDRYARENGYATVFDYLRPDLADYLCVEPGDVTRTLSSSMIRLIR